MPHTVKRTLLSLMLVCGATLTCGCGGPSATPTPPKWPALVFSKETTYITEPVDADGFPDYGAAINARLSEGVTPENNAYVGLMQIYGPAAIKPDQRARTYEALKVQPLPEAGAYLDDGKAYFDGLKGPDPSKPAYFDEWDRAFETPWKEADAPKIARWLAMNEAALAKLPAALNRPRYYRPLVPKEKGGPLSLCMDPYMDKHRPLAHLLLMRGLRSLGSGDVDQAAADAFLLHQFARHLATESNLADYLLALYVEWHVVRLEAAIAHHGKMTVAAAREHAAWLAKLPSFPQFQIECERLAFLDMVRSFAQGRMDELLFPGLGVTKETCPLPSEQIRRATDWNETYRLCSESFNEWETAAKIVGVKERRTACGKVDAEFKTRHRAELATPIDWKAALDARQLGRRVAHHMVDLLLFDPSHTLATRDWGRSHRELLQVSFALAAYRTESGSYPDTLAPLVPKYLPQLPIDHWSNRPYRFRLEEGGYVFWGVGTDEKDDGGHDTFDHVMAVK